MEHLNNLQTYNLIESDPTYDIIERINKILNELLYKSLISKKLHKILFVTDASLGKIRIFTKVPKDTFSFMPIINSTNHPTTNLCIHFDLILKPLYAKTETFLKDSQHLIRDSIDLNFEKNSFLFSCDFEALYSNINHEDCLNVVTEYI